MNMSRREAGDGSITGKKIWIESKKRPQSRLWGQVLGQGRRLILRTKQREIAQCCTARKGFVVTRIKSLNIGRAGCGLGSKENAVFEGQRGVA